jgi:hypothetical protein
MLLGSGATLDSALLGSGTMLDSALLGSGTTLDAALLGSGTMLDSALLGSGTTLDSALLGSGITLDSTLLGSGATLDSAVLDSGMTLDAVVLTTSELLASLELGTADELGSAELAGSELTSVELDSAELTSVELASAELASVELASVELAAAEVDSIELLASVLLGTADVSEGIGAEVVSTMPVGPTRMPLSDETSSTGPSWTGGALGASAGSVAEVVGSTMTTDEPPVPTSPPGSSAVALLRAPGRSKTLERKSPSGEPLLVVTTGSAASPDSEGSSLGSGAVPLSNCRLTLRGK